MVYLTFDMSWYKSWPMLRVHTLLHGAHHIYLTWANLKTDPWLPQCQCHWKVALSSLGLHRREECCHASMGCTVDWEKIGTCTVKQFWLKYIILMLGTMTWHFNSYPIADFKMAAYKICLQANLINTYWNKSCFNYRVLI